MSSVMAPLSVVFIPAVSSVRFLNVSWRLVPLPASVSMSCASVSPRPFMLSAIFIPSPLCKLAALRIKEFRSSLGRLVRGRAR